MSNNTIEIDNKKYRLEDITQADHERNQVIDYEFVGRIVVKLSKFSLYMLISFNELLIKILKSLFLKDYEPFTFKRFKNSKKEMLSKIADEDINKYRVQFASDLLARHEYNFKRSEQFLAQYKYLQVKLKQIADEEIKINTEIYRDIFKRINILIAESENQALREGYNHARNTHYSLYNNEINEDFIRDKILKGESNTDWKELKEKLENE